MTQTRITDEWILDRFDTIYTAYRFGFARLLVTLRRDFGGDLDAMFVLLTLSLGTESEGWAEALFADSRPLPQKRLTNTQSISLASGIPRETVRRKLEAMQERGWVSRDDAGNWTPTNEAAKDLRASSHETVRFIRTLTAAAMAAGTEDARKQPSPEL